jgi:outer membrane lipoprotein-sorting protein
VNEQRDDVSEVEQEVGAFFREVREEERAPDDLWERVGARIEAGGASEGGRRGVRRWVWAAGVAAALVVGAVVVAIGWGDGAPSVSAEEVLARAVAASVSPESVGIRTLVVEREWTIYYLGPERRGEVFASYDVRSWYAAPDRQRVEFDLDGAKFGDEVISGSQVTVWDGEEVWSFIGYGEERQVKVYRQDPDGDLLLQAGSGMPFTVSDMLGSGCRTPRLMGGGEVAGRETDVLELTRSSCGRLMPGSDGPSMVWVDRDTGFVLGMENHAVDGTLAASMRVSSIGINGPIADERFEWETLPGVVEERTYETYWEGATRVQPWEALTLEEARDAATFPLVVPQMLPVGFELEVVDRFWSTRKPEADRVLLRYVDASGNWLVVEQGFEGLYALFASTIPEWASGGTAEVNGIPRSWVDGDLFRGFETGTMLMLGWSLEEDGSVIPDGIVVLDRYRLGRPRAVVLATNVLSLEELVAVAESME